SGVGNRLPGYKARKRFKMVFAAVPLSCWCVTAVTSATNGVRRVCGFIVQGPTFLMSRARVLSARQRCATASGGIRGAGARYQVVTTMVFLPDSWRLAPGTFSSDSVFTVSTL